jgi:tetrahydromethanopterin S-methyltransferase subunit A
VLLLLLLLLCGAEVPGSLQCRALQMLHECNHGREIRQAAAL